MMPNTAPLTPCPHCGVVNKASASYCRACGKSLIFVYQPLQPGQQLKNYTLLSLLSDKGGMGTVYLAEDVDTFGRLVVIKEMLDYFDPHDPQAARAAQERFREEAQTLAALKHRGIPQIYTFFSVGVSNYIVMEYIEGQDLEQGLTHQDKHGAVIPGQAYPQAEVIRNGVALCRVLEYLAQRKPSPVVHHDIKPPNVLLDTNNGEVRLVDFGTAKARLLQQPGGGVGLQKSSIYGTSGYAPPEQYQGQSESRSDVYALAATLYHLATDDDPRDHPFSFPRLAQLGAFGQVLLGALNSNVALRPTAGVLRQQLEALLFVPSPPVTPPPVQTVPIAAPAQRSTRWRTMLVAACGIAMALALFLTVVRPGQNAASGGIANVALLPQATTASQPVGTGASTRAPAVTNTPPSIVLPTTRTPAPTDTPVPTVPPSSETPTPAPSATPAVVSKPAIANNPGPSSPAGNTLRINVGSEPNNVDPQQASFVGEIQFIMLNYQPLMSFGLDLKPVPGAAESYTVSDDGLTYTFTLRPNQRYSDGEPLTAENFEYAFKRLADPTLAGEYRDIARAIAGYNEYTDAITTGGLQETDITQLQKLRDAVGVQALDDNTLEIRLAEQAPYFLNVLALWVGAPSRQDLVDVGGETWWSNPATYIGNGPYQIIEWDHGSRALWQRNANYVRDENMPTVDTIEFAMIGEGAVAFEAYRNDELDFGAVGAEDLPTVRGDRELSTQASEVTGSCTFYLGFNNARPPFNNKDVRKAFAHAIDRDTWVRDVFNGLAKKTVTFIPPGFPGHEENETRYDFNPQAAKDGLAAAGFPGGQGLAPIKLTYSSSARNKTRNEFLAAQIQNNLGVSVTLDPVDPTVYTALTKEPATTPQIFVLGWCADYPDPQNFLSLVFKTGGISAGRISYSNPEFDALVAQADKELDETKRFALYKQAQDILIEDQPVAFLNNDAGIRLQKPWVTGVQATPLDYFPGIFSLNTLQVKY